LSFRRVEDASSAVVVTKLDPIKYQVASLDPPSGSGLQTAPANVGGVVESVMTVRSVVLASAQWSNGGEAAEPALMQHATDLLGYANAKVVAYETARP
jgi:hypothetical protein